MSMTAHRADPRGAEVAHLRAELAAARREREATADVLRAIATAPADLQHVLDTLVQRDSPRERVRLVAGRGRLIDHYIIV